MAAQHGRCYERRQRIVLPDHRLAALTMDQRSQGSALEQAFDALDPEAREFHLGLKRHPVKTSVQLRRLLGLVRVYGTPEMLLAIARALEFAAYESRTFCLQNVGAGSFPRPLCRLHSGASRLMTSSWSPRIRLFTSVSVTPPPRTLIARRLDNLQAWLDRDRAELKLPEIAKSYREVLDETARKGSFVLEVLAILIGLERAAREQRALERRLL